MATAFAEVLKRCLVPRGADRPPWVVSPKAPEVTDVSLGARVPPALTIDFCLAFAGFELIL